MFTIDDESIVFVLNEDTENKGKLNCTERSVIFYPVRDKSVLF